MMHRAALRQRHSKTGARCVSRATSLAVNNRAWANQSATRCVSLRDAYTSRRADDDRTLRDQRAEGYVPRGVCGAARYCGALPDQRAGCRARGLARRIPSDNRASADERPAGSAHRGARCGACDYRPGSRECAARRVIYLPRDAIGITGNHRALPSQRPACGMIRRSAYAGSAPGYRSTRA
jgi:hypothetical protein